MCVFSMKILRREDLQAKSNHAEECDEEYNAIVKLPCKDFMRIRCLD